MNHPRPSLFEQNPVAWYDGAVAQSRLTLQDKLSLNRRAKAHGLPALWPEAEHHAWTPPRGAWLSTPWHPDSLVEKLMFGGGGLGWPAGFWQGGVVGPMHGLQNNPALGRGLFPPSGRFDDSWLGDLIWPELICEIGSALSGALRSFFSRFRGPIPW